MRYTHHLTLCVTSLCFLFATACGDGESVNGDGATDAGADSSDAGDTDIAVEADATGDSDTAGEPDAAEPVVVVLVNHGGDMEGHTPRGFRGQGTGLFVGDNLNSNFPENDGVQAFLSFDLSALPDGEVVSATLSARAVTTTGTPFEDLGAVTAEELRYDVFSADLWDRAPATDGHSCVLAESAQLPHACDIGPIVQRARDDGYGSAQVRLRLERAGDGDGAADLVIWNPDSSNTNQPGLFELEVAVR